MPNRPKVSIVSITYNQEAYIREALDSFVSQKVSFDLEIIIADDCSTDRTPQIIEEYAVAHPELFKPILRNKNLGPQKNSIEALRVARGDYIALCEGDDYWTDPKKLQQQVNFLDSHTDYSLCFHPVEVFVEGDQKSKSIYPDRKSSNKFSLRELLRTNFIQTNSVMYRRQNYDNLPDNVMPLDWYLHLYHAQFGKIGFQNRVMSAYRRHPGGVWWNSDKNLDEIWKKYGLAHLALFDEQLNLFGDQKIYRDIILSSASKLMDALTEVDQRYPDSLIHSAVMAFPAFAENYISYLRQAVLAKDEAVELKAEEVVKLTQSLDSKNDEKTILKY